MFGFGRESSVAQKWVREEFARREDARRAEFIARLDALVADSVGNAVSTIDMIDALTRKAQTMRQLRAMTASVDARL
jgi:hypothetical protein